MARVKVMSFNIQHGVGDDGVLNLKRTGEVIANSGAELIGLQEVDRNWNERSNFEDQAKWLAEYLGMEFVYAANLDNDPVESGAPRRQYGLAVLSKYPIVHSHHHFLSSGSEQRGLLETNIKVDNTMIHFYNTHLGLSQEERKVQVNEVIEVTDRTNKPSIIVGDFNAEPTSVELQKMFGRYEDVHDQATFPSSDPDRKIDYLLISDQFTTEAAKVLDTLASDHLPIFAELKIKV